MINSMVHLTTLNQVCYNLLPFQKTYHIQYFSIVPILSLYLVFTKPEIQHNFSPALSLTLHRLRIEIELVVLSRNITL